MKRLAFLGVGSAIILGLGVMGATPAFADNGPHVASSTDMTVDRCAGCHRAHTAADAYLLVSPETSLCETCHDGLGATTNVVDGVSTGGGALRAGGFTQAQINGASGVKGVSITPGVSITGSTVTSKHDVGVTGVAWGGGASGKDGTAITLECASCHDPHGNGNYRILRPVPADAAGVTLGGAVGITSITPAGYWINAEGRTRYYYDVVTSAPHGFKLDDSVTFYDTNSAYDGYTTAGLIGAGVSLWTGDPAQPNWHTKSTITSTKFTIYSGTKLTVTASQGRVAYALSNGISEVIPTAGVAKYYTWNLHGLVTGQTVTVKGTTGFDQTGVITVTDKLSFTMPSATTATWTGNAQIVGIPDVTNKAFKIYTTANYWLPDDHNYTSSDKTGTVLSQTNTAANNGPTAFISNISQWCAQCHTRILAGNGAWEVNTGDSKFAVMHRSQSGKEGSPNCVQCHVAHGTTANMEGFAGNTTTPQDPDHQYSKAVGTEFASTNVSGATAGMGAGDSFLLRVNNRGTCNMCHGL